MKDVLTKRQEEILTFIKKYSAEHGYPPAIREICAGVGLSSTATVFVHVKNLENKGYLKTENNKTPGQNRGILTSALFAKGRP